MKESRLYSLFYKGEDGKYYRINVYSYKKKTAVKLYQTALINGSLCGIPMYLRHVERGDVTNPQEIAQVTANYNRWKLMVNGH